MLNEKQHYYLTAGHVVFLEKETQRVFATRTYNGILKTPVKHYGLKDVQRIQNSFYVRATQEVDQTLVTTVDMVVTSMMYMGFFTEEEFTAGTTLATEVVKPSPSEEPRFQ